MPLNEDPNAMTDEEYEAHYSDPDLELHFVPEEVLATAEEVATATVYGDLDWDDEDDAVLPDEDDDEDTEGVKD